MNWTQRQLVYRALNSAEVVDNTLLIESCYLFPHIFEPDDIKFIGTYFKSMTHTV